MIETRNRILEALIPALQLRQGKAQVFEEKLPNTQEGRRRVSSVQTISKYISHSPCPGINTRRFRIEKRIGGILHVIVKFEKLFCTAFK